MSKQQSDHNAPSAQSEQVNSTTPADQSEVKDPSSDQQQEFQPESGATEDQEEIQARRRNAAGAARVESDSLEEA